MNEANYRYKFWQRRLTRRHMLRGATIGGLGVAASIAIGCGEGEAPSAQTTATPATGVTQATGTAAPSAVRHNVGYSADEVQRMDIEEAREVFHGKYLKDLWWTKGVKPKYGGVLRFNHGPPATWDLTGAYAAALPSWAYLHNQLLDFEIADTMENNNFHKVAFDLAESMEQPDALTYVFHLHKGVKYHNLPPVNGRELKAQDVKYVLDVYKNSPVQAGTYIDVASFEAVDDYTVRIKMAQPAAYFLLMLTQPFHFVFAPEHHESGRLGEMPIGTGAFIWESGEANVGMKVRKNPDYFKKDQWTGMQLPYLDAIETTVFPDPAAELAAFRTKQIDHWWPWNKSLLIDLLKTTPDVVVGMVTPPPSAQPHFPIRNDLPPWNDVRVRRALQLAIDKQAIVDSVFDGWAASGYGLNWDWFGQEWPWTPEQLGQWHQFDPERAKQLLVEAGFEYGKGIGRPVEIVTSFTSGAWYEAMVLGSDYLSQIGLQMNFKQVDAATFRDQYFNVKYPDMAAYHSVGPGVEPHAYVWETVHSKAPKNYYGVRDPKIDELADKQRVTMDTEERKKIILEWMAYDLDQCTRIWLTNDYKVVVRHPNIYNAIDTVHAWLAPGWGSKGRERIWKDA